MEIAGSTVVVTGAARGIGAALARRFAQDGAAVVALSDLDDDDAAEVAEEISATTSARAVAIRTDVAVEAEVRALVEQVEADLGPIDLFCSNAGIATGLGLGAPDEWWEAAWSVNFQAHLYAARAVVPRMVERGHGHLLQTASAAGLLIQPGDAPYSVTKHAAVAFAEWLLLTYGDQGIGVSVLCPQGVRTDLLMTGVETGTNAARAVLASGNLLEPAEVAEVAARGVADNEFLLLPHPEVHEFMRRRADDPARWIRGVRRSVSRIGAHQPT